MNFRAHRAQRTLRAALAVLGALAVGALLSSCGLSRSSQVHLYAQQPFPKKLSDWHLFTKKSSGLEPNARVIPYDLNTPLFSDYAGKHRFVWMPEGAAAEYRDDAAFDFPVGTILVKSFTFPAEGRPGEERYVETRLLVRTSSGWTPLPYIWNATQTEAMLELVPDPVSIHWTDETGRKHDLTYRIPNTNECHECHDNNKVLLPIGPKARNLNRELKYSDGVANQLARWAQVGYLRGAPDPSAAPRAAKWNVASDGSLDERARSYLDNNCAHCHQPGGTAGYTGVDFRLGHFEPAQFGFCKRPNSAGFMGDREFDIVPGRPEKSILLYRLESVAPKVMMPQIGRDVVHTEGVALVRAWIASLDAQSCRSAGD